MELVWPALEYLPDYQAALQRGWSADTVRGDDAATEALAAIAADPVGFVTSLVDRDATGKPISLPDGSTAPRLPGYHLWMWDGEFCGSISFRWQLGTTELPPHCLGHIGFSVVPWKRERGYATEALKLLLPRVTNEGLDHVELTTDADNVISQKVILANGGVFVGTFRKPAAYGGGHGHLYRIPVGPAR